MVTRCYRDYTEETLCHADSAKGPTSRAYTVVISVGGSMAVGDFPVVEVFEDYLDMKGCMYKNVHLT